MVQVVSWRIFLSITSQALSPPCISWPIQSPTNMSTTYMVTTSVEMDLTLGNDTEIVTWICIMVTTWANGTPLGPTSFREEDLIELCVGLGQEHLEGVLQLLDTEAVLALPSGSNMTATLHLFAMVSVWHVEPVNLCIWPPWFCR